MPIQEFECSNLQCRKRFEKIFVSRGEFDRARAIGHNCPDCNSPAVRSIGRTGPPQFRGSGFYQTDYKQ